MKVLYFAWIRKRIGKSAEENLRWRRERRSRQGRSGWLGRPPDLALAVMVPPVMVGRLGLQPPKSHFSRYPKRSLAWLGPAGEIVSIRSGGLQLPTDRFVTIRP
jgi:hypothetical protein